MSDERERAAAENGVYTDEDGNVTVFAPVATASSEALAPGSSEPPEFIVFNHEGRNVLYKREG